MNNLNVLAASASQMVARNAQQAIQYQQALDQQQISQAEYMDLMQDLAAMVHVAEAADDLNNKILLEQCLNAAITVVGAVY
jgi:predicted metal-binding transcription factor (methanogenesis marker protein 9)